MIVTAHQPVYLPWLGFFHKVLLADELVSLDNVEIGGTHHKDNFVARNKIKTATGPLWLTVPLRASHRTTIDQAMIDNSTAWQKRHWLAIEYNYKRAPYFSVYAELLRPIYERPWERIADLNHSLMVDFFWSVLKIKTKLVLASKLQLKQNKAMLILELCRKINTDIYVSGALGKNYLHESTFTTDGIQLYFQNYQHPTYRQLWGEFVPYLSTLDLIFNEGPRSRKIILSGNITKL